MIGWEIQVYTQADGGHSPSTMQSKKGSFLAVWTVCASGILWPDNLAIAAKAINLGVGRVANRKSAYIL
jgi:hypothetical protein